MQSQTPTLRGMQKTPAGPWHLGSIPDQIVYMIGKQLVHRLAIGHADITGDDFDGIFANAIGGEHRGSPLGIADVLWNGCGWSVKTIKRSEPFASIGKHVRLISGRNSPDFSFGISDSRKDLEKTGKAVLAIWNKRINEAKGEHDDLRVVVLIRNMDSREFLLFEEEAIRFAPNEYFWKTSKQNTIWGYRKTNSQHCFVWQPHGGQFTILREVPASARQFRINRVVSPIEQQHILRLARYKQDMISILV